MFPQINILFKIVRERNRLDLEEIKKVKIRTQKWIYFPDEISKRQEVKEDVLSIIHA